MRSSVPKIPEHATRNGLALADKGNTPHLDHVLLFHHNLSPSTFDVDQLPTIDIGLSSRPRPYESIFTCQQQSSLSVVEEDDVLDSGSVEESPITGCSDGSSFYGGTMWFSRAVYKKAIATRSLPQVSAAVREQLDLENDSVASHTATLFKAKSLPSITLTLHETKVEAGVAASFTPPLSGSKGYSDANYEPQAHYRASLNECASRHAHGGTSRNTGAPRANPKNRQTTPKGPPPATTRRKVKTMVFFRKFIKKLLL